MLMKGTGKVTDPHRRLDGSPKKPPLKATLRGAKLITAIMLISAGSFALHLRAQGQVEGDRLINGPVSKSFSKYDTNEDGYLTELEFRDAQLLKKVDSNGDNRISLQEARSAARRGVFEGIQLPTPLNREAQSREALSTGQMQNTSPASKDSTADITKTEFSKEIRQAPRRLNSIALGIGRRINFKPFMRADSATHVDAAGNADKQNASPHVVVIALTGTGCPLCLKYSPTLARIEDQYKEQGVEFIYVNPNDSENQTRIDRAIQQHGFDGLYIHDQEMLLTQTLQANTSTEVFVLDSSHTLRYRGAVDDQYGFGYALDKPKNHYLTDAIDAVLAGQTPNIAATTAPGCEIYFPNDTPELAEQDVTYHRQISRIMQTHCVSCHRENGSAPFALEQYESVSDFGKMIASVVSRGIMPPWFAEGPPPSNLKHDVANSGDSSSHGTSTQHKSSTQHWANDRTVPDEDRQRLIQWVSAGMPEGDPSEAPLPVKYPEEWAIGTPDLVLQIPEPISIKAEGQMPYVHRLVSTTLDKDQWVSAVEIRPTAISAVHHVLVYIAKPGSGLRAIQEGSAGFLAAFVPGNSHQIYPDGYAKKIAAGSRLIFQIHYTPNGQATTDQTRLGLRFSKQPPQYEVKNHGIANHRILIPANADHHRENASLTVPSDIKLLAVMPHMHVRGKAFEYELVYPDGERQQLLNVPRYDFNWQLEYRLSEPLSIPAGTRIELAGWFDNSAENPANPDPDKDVRWGPQTTDEMMLGYVEYIVDGERIAD